MRTLVVALAIVMLFANTAIAKPTIKDLSGWTEIYTTSDENTIKIVLQNPVRDDVYALVELNQSGIRYFIIVEDNTLTMYMDFFGEFDQKDMSEEAEKNVWAFLRDKLGIRTI